MTKLLALSVAVLLAAASLTPVSAADSPQGMKCPTQTMDGKWVEATNVTPDCVAKSLV